MCICWDLCFQCSQLINGLYHKIKSSALASNNNVLSESLKWAVIYAYLENEQPLLLTELQEWKESIRCYQGGVWSSCYSGFKPAGYQMGGCGCHIGKVDCPIALAKSEQLTNSYCLQAAALIHRSDLTDSSLTEQKCDSAWRREFPLRSVLKFYLAVEGTEARCFFHSVL